MKKWINPEIKSLNAKCTCELGYDIMPYKSEASCTKTQAEAVVNKGKGCSVTSCKYYSKNNNGKGNGGKCGGSEEVPLS